MLLSRLCQANLTPVLKYSAPLLKSTINVQLVNVKNSPLVGRQFVRDFTKESKSRLTQAERRKTLKEQILAPAGESAFNIGKGAIAGGAVVGLGALCYYGLGLSNAPGAIDQAA